MWSLLYHTCIAVLSTRQANTYCIHLLAFTYRQDLISSPQFSAEVCRPSCEYKGHKNAFSIFSSYDVEAQSGRALVQDNLPGLPVYTVKIIHQFRVRRAQHLHRHGRQLLCKHTHARDACMHTRIRALGLVQMVYDVDTYWGLPHLVQFVPFLTGFLDTERNALSHTHAQCHSLRYTL